MNVIRMRNTESIDTLERSLPHREIVAARQTLAKSEQRERVANSIDFIFVDEQIGIAARTQLRRIVDAVRERSAFHDQRLNTFFSQRRKHVAKIGEPKRFDCRSA